MLLCLANKNVFTIFLINSGVKILPKDNLLLLHLAQPVLVQPNSIKRMPKIYYVSFKKSLGEVNPFEQLQAVHVLQAWMFPMSD